MGDGDNKTVGCGFKLSAWGAYGPSTSASDKLKGGGASIGGERRYLDRTFFVDVSAELEERYAKLYEGIRQAYDSYLFAISIGRTNLSVDDGEDAKKKTSQSSSTSEKVVAYEQQSHPGGDVDNLYIGSRSSLFAWRHFFGDKRENYIEPLLGLEVGTLYPFVDKDEIGEFPGSPLVIKFLFQLSLGFGSDTEKQIQDAPVTIFDSAYLYSKELLNYVQRYLQYKIYDRYGDPFTESNNLQSKDGSQYLEDVPGLYLGQTLMGGLGMSEFVESCYMADASGSPDCKIVAGARVVVGLVSIIAGASANSDTSGGGNVLISGGVVDIMSAGRAFLATTTVDSHYQLIIHLLAGAAVELGGAALGSSDVGVAGAQIMTSATWKPDQSRTRLVKDEKIIVRPYNGHVKGRGDASASVAKRVELKNGVVLETEADSPILQGQNIGARADNAAGGATGYDNIDAQTVLRNSAGYKQRFMGDDDFSLDGVVAVHTMLVTGPGEPTAGVGASVAVEGDFEIAGVDVLVGARALVEKPIGDDANISVGPEIGITWGGED
jgi:hypothetical protein